MEWWPGGPIAPNPATQVMLFPGSSVHFQLDLPRNASLDYNLYIYEMVTPIPNATFELVGFSENETRINGNFGTLPELVEIQNHTASQRILIPVVRSARGYSATEEFVLHVGTNPINNAIIDQHPNQARTISIAYTANIVVRDALQSTVDNDWYRIVTPSALHFLAISMALDPHSVSHGYAIEVYAREGAGFRRISNTGIDGIPNTTYYIRVYNTRKGNVPLSGQNYELTLTKHLIKNDIRILRTPGHDTLRGHLGVLPIVRPVFNGRQLTVEGIAFARSPVNGILHVQEGARVELVLHNPNRSGPTAFSSGVGIVASSGVFRATTSPAAPPIGTHNTPGPFGGTRYDVGYFWVQAMAGGSETFPVYIMQAD